MEGTPPGEGLPKVRGLPSPRLAVPRPKLQATKGTAALNPFGANKMTINKQASLRDFLDRRSSAGPLTRFLMEKEANMGGKGKAVKGVVNLIAGGTDDAAKGVAGAVKRNAFLGAGKQTPAALQPAARGTRVQAAPPSKPVNLAARPNPSQPPTTPRSGMRNSGAAPAAPQAPQGSAAPRRNVATQNPNRPPTSAPDGGPAATVGRGGALDIPAQPAPGTAPPPPPAARRGGLVARRGAPPEMPRMGDIPPQPQSMTDFFDSLRAQGRGGDVADFRVPVTQNTLRSSGIPTPSAAAAAEAEAAAATTARRAAARSSEAAATTEARSAAEAADAAPPVNVRERLAKLRADRAAAQSTPEARRAEVAAAEARGAEAARRKARIAEMQARSEAIQARSADAAAPTASGAAPPPGSTSAAAADAATPPATTTGEVATTGATPGGGESADNILDQAFTTAKRYALPVGIIGAGAYGGARGWQAGLGERDAAMRQGFNPRTPY